MLDIQLAPESRQAFARFTTANVGRAVALRTEGRLLATPVIGGPIQDGNIALDPGVGDYALTLKDMVDIAGRLSSGKARIEVNVQPRQ